MSDEAVYGIEELAQAGGVTRRTVRYYVQEGLLPSPRGVGRGRHYGPEHLERLLRLKAMQERGLALAHIRHVLSGSGKATLRAADAADAPADLLARAPWTRVELMPGVELHVSGEARVPGPSRLVELSEWCRRHCRREEKGDDEP